jgi:RNA polymerase-binding transcription factor DksA
MRARSTEATCAGPCSHLSTSRVEGLRSRLLSELDEHVTALAQCGEAFLSGSSQAVPALERAKAAVHMYCTRRTIEEIEGALERIELGRYGICQVCGRPIPGGSLDLIPQARFCAACSPTSVVPPAGRSEVPRLGSDRTAHTVTGTRPV